MGKKSNRRSGSVAIYDGFFFSPRFCCWCWMLGRLQWVNANCDCIFHVYSYFRWGNNVSRNEASQLSAIIGTHCPVNNVRIEFMWRKCVAFCSDADFLPFIQILLLQQSKYYFIQSVFVRTANNPQAELRNPRIIKFLMAALMIRIKIVFET